MGKLIRLELQKMTMKSYILGALAVDLVLLGIFFTIYFTGGKTPFQGLAEAFDLIIVLVRLPAMLLAAVLLSKLIIEEYCQKTISMLFLYPISKKDILIAKILLVVIMTLTYMFLSAVLIAAAILMINSYVFLIPGTLSVSFLLQGVLELFINSFLYSLLSLIPLIFGMMKKSSAATLISSVFLSLIAGETPMDANLPFRWMIPVLLAALGLLAAYLSIRKVENSDLVL